MGRSTTVLVKGFPEGNEGDGGGRGVEDRGRTRQDQGCVAVPTGKLDNLGGSCQLQNPLVRPVDDPKGKNQLSYSGYI